MKLDLTPTLAVSLILATLGVISLLYFQLTSIAIEERLDALEHGQPATAEEIENSAAEIFQ